MKAAFNFFLKVVENKEEVEGSTTNDESCEDEDDEEVKETVSEQPSAPGEQTLTSVGK